MMGEPHYQWVQDDVAGQGEHVDSVSPEIGGHMRDHACAYGWADEEENGWGMDASDEQVIAKIDANYPGGAAAFVRDNA